MADGAPGVVAHGLDQHVTAGAFTPLELLLVTAHTALGRVALGALGDPGGVHGPLKGDEVALGFAFHRMTGGTGHGIARVVTGLVVFDFFLMDETAETTGFMAAPLGLGFSPTGKMTMADGAPLSVGSREAADADPAPQDVRHAAPARAIAASRSSVVPFLMCLSFAYRDYYPNSRRGKRAGHLVCALQRGTKHLGLRVPAQGGRYVKEGRALEGFSRLKGKA